MDAERFAALESRTAGVANSHGKFLSILTALATIVVAISTNPKAPRGEMVGDLLLLIDETREEMGLPRQFAHLYEGEGGG